MRVLVDGVFFQLASTGIARVWMSLLARLGGAEGFDVLMLDRGGAPSIAGVEPIAFPSYTMTYTAADSFLIQEFCDRYDIDVFTSTYYTTAVKTPQVQMIYDMIPEVLGFDLSARAWKEKQLALSYASRFACISQSTREDLHRFYSGIDRSRSVVAYCGVDTEVFNPQGVRALPALRQVHGLDRPYVLLVGSRDQHKGYKNARLFFDAVAGDETAEFDIVCVGGEPRLQPEWSRALPGKVRALRLDLSDAELAAAYAGAIALIYPSLYEGFGMPVVEAMASGCPVITTHHGALREVAGDAALIVSGHDRDELLSNFHQIQEPNVRRRLIEAGLERASRFDWGVMASRFRALLSEAYVERSDAAVARFHARWNELRRMQADVDIGVD